MVGEQKGQSVDQSATPAKRIVPARIDAIVGVVPCIDEKSGERGRWRRE